MLRIWMISIVTISILIIPLQSTWAAGTYVTDTFRISLRRGPSIENKILKFIPSGLPVEVLNEEDGWSQVQIKESDDNVIKGWVLSRYLVMRPPWKDQAESLKIENEQLLIKLKDLEKSLLALKTKEQVQAAELKSQSAKLAQSQHAYQQLKTESAGYLELKKNFENVTHEIETLSVENNQLKNDQTHRWLGIGAGILLIGLIIGLRFGIKQKKYRSSTLLS